MSRVHRTVAAWTALMAVAAALIAQVVLPMPLTRGPIPLAMICTAHGLKSLESEQNPPIPRDQQPPYKQQHCVFCNPAAAQLLPAPAPAVLAPGNRRAPQYGVGFEIQPFSVSILEAIRSRAPPPIA